MSGGGETAAELAADARASLGTLRTAWAWLGAARQPGSRCPIVSRPVSADRSAAQLTEWRLNRAGAVESARQGHTSSSPHPVPVMLGPVQTRTVIAAELVDLVARLWRAAWDDAPPTIHVRDLTSRLRTCHWCVRGSLLTPHWLGGALLRCPHCHGGQRVPAPCQACQATGACGCDRADVTVALCLPAIGYVLDHADVEAVADADETLYELAQSAETAVGLGKDRRRLATAECPACGARELYAEVSSSQSREWSIHCQGPDCVCAGPGCACGIGTPRRKARRHRWPSVTWTGPHGLAQRLGVDLPHTRPAGQPWWPPPVEHAPAA